MSHFDSSVPAAVAARSHHDQLEMTEWQEALMSLVDNAGAERAREILD
nr:hypothetical protein [Tanacetum cinerariifolium]